MKLVSFRAGGRDLFGVVAGDGVVAMNERIGCGSLREALSKALLGKIKTAAQGARPDHALNDVTLLPVSPDPELIVWVGVNYRSHATETGRDIPKQPSMFIRRTNTL